METFSMRRSHAEPCSVLTNARDVRQIKSLSDRPCPLLCVFGSLCWFRVLSVYGWTRNWARELVFNHNYLTQWEAGGKKRLMSLNSA